MPVSLFEQITRRDTAIVLADAGEMVTVGGRTVAAIFTDKFERVLVEGEEQDQEYITSLSLFIDVSENDFPITPPRGTSVFRGTDRYTVREIEPEGLGMIRLHLSRSDLSLPINPDFASAETLPLMTPVTIPAGTALSLFAANGAVYVFQGSMLSRLDYQSSSQDYVITLLNNAFFGGSDIFVGGSTLIDGRVYVGVEGTTADRLFSFNPAALGRSVTLVEAGTLPIAGPLDVVSIGTARAFWTIDQGGTHVYESRNLAVPPEASRFSLSAGAEGPVTLLCGTAVGEEVLVFEASTGTSARVFLLSGAGRLVLVGSLTVEANAKVMSVTVLDNQLYLAVVSPSEQLSIIRVPVKPHE